MGVLNITPNSFSDAGQYLHLDAACERVSELLRLGVDIIDVGGEATNPHGGYKPVSVSDEIKRVVPVIHAIRKMTDIPISIDTCKAEVMEQAVMAGASMINDIMALQGKGSLVMAKRLDVPICLMHMQGTPQTMQHNPTYPLGVVKEIDSFFSERIAACKQAGIAETQLILDPGIGFGKLTSHNLSILKHIGVFKRHQLPLLLGVSRKRLIGDVLNKPVSERLIGGLAIALDAVNKGVNIIRTHDVDETKQALMMIDAINEAG